MAAWLDFFITAISSIVSLLFAMDLGLGFSLGDAIVALMVVVVASALVLKIGKS